MTVLAAASILGGIGALLFEVAWIRGFSLFFGAATHATAAVLAAYLAGLAAGTLAAPRIRARFPGVPAGRLFATLEGAGAGLALGASYALPWAEEVYGLMCADGSPLAGARGFVRTAIGAVLVVPPTFLFGAAFPALAEEADPAGRRSGRIGALQALNTLGGAAGAVAAGFVGLPALGLRATSFLAAGLQILAAAIVVVFRRDSAPLPEKAIEERREPIDVRTPRTGLVLPPRVLLPAAAIAGAAALSQEVVLSRLLAQVLGGTLPAVATVLASYLLGLSLGGLLAAGLAARLRSRSAAAAAFAASQLGAAVLALGYPFALPRTSELAYEAAMRLGPDFAGYAATAAIVSGALLVPLAILLGAAYPFALAALPPDVAIRRAARPLAWSTAGSIAGSIAAGFVLVPILGLFRAVAAGAAGSSLAAALVLPVRPAARAVLSAVAVLLPATIAVRLDDAAERPLAMSFFMGESARRMDELSSAAGAARSNASAFLAGPPPGTTLHYAAGPAATVLVREQGGHRSLYLNGKVVASTIPIDRKNQALLGHLPLVLRPGAKRVLIVGLGTGGTLGAALAHTVREVVCAEIAAEVPDAARRFSESNDHALEDARLDLVLDDARNVLRLDRSSFDVVTSDPVHPWVAGAASLYSWEYYRLARSRLAPGGLMVQWIPLYEMGLEDLRSIVATFLEVFPEATLWAAHYDVLLVSTAASPLLADLAAARREVQEPAVARELAAVAIEGLDELLAHVLAGPEELRRWTVGAPILRDDRLFLEGTLPRHLFEETQGENLDALLDLADDARRSSILDATLPALRDLDECSRERLRAAVRARGAALRATAAFYRRAEAEAGIAWARSLAESPRIRLGWWSRRIGDALFEASASDSDPLSVAGLAWSLFLHDGDAAAAESQASRALALVPAAEGPADRRLGTSLRLLRARARGRMGRLAEAAVDASEAAVRNPCEAEAPAILALLHLHTGAVTAARRALDTLERLDPDGVSTEALRARVLDAEGKKSEALAAATRVEERDPGNSIVRPILAGGGS